MPPKPAINHRAALPKRSKNHLFSIFFRTIISHNPYKKECAMKFSQLKKHVPYLKFCILVYRIIGIIDWRQIHMYVNIIMYFKIMSKVVKHTCRLRNIYTHDQLNTLDISISFLRIFLRGGGGAKFNFAPGRQLPSLRHCCFI